MKRVMKEERRSKRSNVMPRCLTEGYMINIVIKFQQDCAFFYYLHNLLHNLKLKCIYDSIDCV